MSQAWIAWFFLFLFPSLSAAASPDVVRLYTFSEPLGPAYDAQPDFERTVKGPTVETVTCAIAALGIEATIEIVPQPRALFYLARGKIDGYFAGDSSIARNQIGLPTKPVALEKWHIVTRAEENGRANPRLGAVSGSNEEAWLRARGQSIYLAVRSPQQLIDLLHLRRIDQVLMDQRVLESLSGTEGLVSRFLRYVPLHLYLSRQFVESHPDFIPTFNQKIPGCINESFSLDAAETAQIRGIAYSLFEELETRFSLIRAIDTGTRIRDLSEILNLDAQWRALAPTQHSTLAQEIAAAPASKSFADWQKTKNGLVTEVMLTNNMGTLVAMSQLTSDFWQGDEAKFEHHIRGDWRNLFVSPIRYDESTSRFQVTVSLPIHSDERWLPVGVVVIGLDVEKALVSENHRLYLHDDSTR